jgi:glucokinase
LDHCFVSAASWAIGLDVGGTKIAGGIVNLDNGDIIAREVIPTVPERGGEAVLDDAIALTQRLAHEAVLLGRPNSVIGVGVPELIDPAGAIRSRHVIDWLELPVRTRFESIGVTTIAADVRAAALAEARLGAGKSARIVAYITVGTGISSCIVIDGKPFAGARGNALVLGSGPLDAICPHCGERSRVVLEEFASGPAITARYNLRAQMSAADAVGVLAAAELGDPIAIDVVRSAGEALGNSIGFFVNIMDPDAVVIGGGLGSSQGLFWDTFADSARAHIWAPETRELPMLRAQFGPDSGIIGAALATQTT